MCAWLNTTAASLDDPLVLFMRLRRGMAISLFVWTFCVGQENDNGVLLRRSLWLKGAGLVATPEHSLPLGDIAFSCFSSL